MPKSQKQVLMLGPSPTATGGIAALVTGYYRCGLFDRWPIVYFSLYEDGSFIRKLNRVLVSFPRYLTKLLTGRAGAVHVHTSFNISFWRKSVFVLPTLLFSRTPVILHFHGGEMQNFYRDSSGPLRRYLTRFILDRATYIVILSKQLARSLDD
ncbi:MAG: glycosyltransferase, partial [Gammaproteobacteria bacterium]